MQPKMFVEHTVNLCVDKDTLVYETPFLRIFKRPEDSADVPTTPTSKPFYAVFVQEIDRRMNSSCVCVQNGDSLEDLIKEYQTKAKEPYYIRFY